jgi:hypothetical protein
VMPRRRHQSKIANSFSFDIRMSIRHARFIFVLRGFQSSVGTE